MPHLCHRCLGVRPLCVKANGSRDPDTALLICLQQPGVEVGADDTSLVSPPGHITQFLQHSYQCDQLSVNVADLLCPDDGFMRTHLSYGTHSIDCDICVRYISRGLECVPDVGHGFVLHVHQPKPAQDMCRSLTRYQTGRLRASQLYVVLYGAQESCSRSIHHFCHDPVQLTNRFMLATCFS